jgi:hypothetical protein
MESPQGELAYAAAVPIGYNGSRMYDSSEPRIVKPGTRRSIVAVVVLLSFCAFLYSPDPLSETFRGVAGDMLEATFDSIAEDAAANRATPLDKAIAHVSLLAGGAAYWLNAPEASKVVWHYCYGDGSELRLDPSYIRTSPVVKQAIDSMKTGETKTVSFKQAEDFRLSLALNPFSITSSNTGGFQHYRVFQKIEFDLGTSGKKIKTEVKLGRFHVLVRDAYVHALRCKPFEAVSEWDG